jgi:hypothetical protein
VDDSPAKTSASERAVAARSNQRVSGTRLLDGLGSAGKRTVRGGPLASMFGPAHDGRVRPLVLLAALSLACSSSSTSPPSAPGDDAAVAAEASAHDVETDAIQPDAADSAGDVATFADVASDAGWLGSCTDTNQCPPGDICTYLPNVSEFLCTRACTTNADCPPPSSGCRLGLCQPG